MSELAYSVEFIELVLESPGGNPTGILSPCVIKESDTSYKMWYSVYNGSNWQIHYATSVSGVDWENRQVVLNVGAEGTYDTTGAIQPSVIKESDDSYKMWYTGHDGTNWRSIIYTTSTDGISWANHQMVIYIGDEGTYDTTSLHTSCVIKESPTSYKMWYAGSNGSNRMLYATSTNGLNWSNHQMIIDVGAEGTYDTTHVLAPCVIKESDTSYKMWYAGYDGSNYRKLYTTSTDGISWSNYQMVIDVGAEGTYDTSGMREAIIIKESDTSYKMWYGGIVGSTWRSIIYATSTDGINWGSYQFSMDYTLEGVFLSAALTKDQDISNCVPFLSWYSNNDGHSGQFFDCYFTDDDGPVINIHREIPNGCDIYIKGYIVEFDPYKVKVYQGEIPNSVSYNAETSVTVTTSGTFDQSKTAMVFHHRVATSGDNTYLSQCMIRGKVNSDGTTLSFRKQVNVTTSYVGHYYLFESIDNDYTVNHTSGTFTGDTSYEVGDYDWHNTFLINSYCTEYSGQDLQYQTMRAYLWGNSRIAMNRNYTGYTCYYAVQKIEFNNEATASGVRYCPKITSYHSMGSTTTDRTINWGLGHVQSTDTLTMVSVQNPTRSSSNTSYKGACYHAIWWDAAEPKFYIKSAESGSDRYPTYYAVDWSGQYPLYPDTGTVSGTTDSGTCPVKSVENISYTLQEHVGVINLSKGQDVNNCIVFKSGYSSQNSEYDQQYRSTTMAYFRGNELYMERGSESWDYYAELSVVEFHPSQVRVQQGHFRIGANATSTTVTLDTEIVPNKTFLLYGSYFGSSEDGWGYHLVRGYIASSTSLTFHRGSSSTYPVLGTYFIAEDLQDWWTVHRYNSGSISATTYSQYFKDCLSERNGFALVGGMIASTTDGPYYAGWRTYYHGPMHFRVDKQINTTSYVSLQVVTFNDRTRTRVHYSHRNLSGTTQSTTYSPYSAFQGGMVTPIFTNLNGLGRNSTSDSYGNVGSYMRVHYDEETNEVTVSRNKNYTSSFDTMNSIYTVHWEGYTADELPEVTYANPTNSFIKSIERLSYTGTIQRKHFYLTKNQIKENCVPIGTWSIGEDAGDVERFFYTFWFDPSSNNLLKFESFWAPDNGGIDADITVIEFDPTQVKVQSGSAWIWGSETSTTVTIDEVDTSKAFIIHYPYPTDWHDDFAAASTAVRFNSSTQLLFETGYNSDDYMLINWYVVECLQDQWKVQHDTQYSSNTYYTHSITPEPEYSTFSIFSQTLYSSTDDPYYLFFRVYPNSDQRGIYSISANCQTAITRRVNFATVTFNENLGIFVEHIHFYFSTSEYSKTYDLNRDYNINNTLVWNGQAQPHMRVNSSSSAHWQSGFVKAVLQDSRTLKVTRDVYSSYGEAWGHVFLIEFPFITHEVSGVVREKGDFVSREVRLHRTDTGELLGSTVSSGTDGSYAFYTTHSGSTYVVCFDNEAGEVYNGLIATDVYPTLISGTFPYVEGWV